jgi:molybdopterin synthase catalytic subunit
MRITVLLFAQLAESIGARSIEVEIPAGSTVADLLRGLEKTHAPIAALRGRLAVAVDERYASLGAVICEEQTIALIPPVSGG